MLGRFPTAKDEIWLSVAEQHESMFNYYIADCRNLLMDIRCYLIGKGAELPSDVFREQMFGEKNRAVGTARVRKATKEESRRAGK